MKLVILARERSERFPRKHLTLIGGEPMLGGIVKRLVPFADVILATGSEKDNPEIARVASEAGAQVYCEEVLPERDLWGRIDKMSRVYNLDYWMLYSGDCPFVDLRLLQPVWDELKKGFADTVNPQMTLNGIEGRHISGVTAEHWAWLGRQLPPDDPRREYPWSAGSGTTAIVPVPWPQEKTRLKTSIDYPFEAAIADKIVRHLERWPKTDDDIMRAYTEITEL